MCCAAGGSASHKECSRATRRGPSRRCEPEQGLTAAVYLQRVLWQAARGECAQIPGQAHVDGWQGGQTLQGLARPALQRLSDVPLLQVGPCPPDSAVLPVEAPLCMHQHAWPTNFAAAVSPSRTQSHSLSINDSVPLHRWSPKQFTCPAQHSSMQVSVNLHLQLRTFALMCWAAITTCS